VARIPTDPASPQDQESLALRRTQLAQHPDRRLDRSGQGARVAPRHLRRLGSPRRGDCVLAVPAKRGEQSGHRVPDGHVADLAADGIDDAGSLEPEDGGLGQREHRLQVAAADLQIR
jgi:hypothetical protein